MKLAYIFRLYPTKKQEARLEHILETCRQLYAGDAERAVCIELMAIAAG